MSTRVIRLELDDNVRREIGGIAARLGIGPLEDALRTAAADWLARRKVEMDDRDPDERYSINEALDELMAKKSGAGRHSESICVARVLQTGFIDAFEIELRAIDRSLTRAARIAHGIIPIRAARVICGAVSRLRWRFSRSFRPGVGAGAHRL